MEYIIINYTDFSSSNKKTQTEKQTQTEIDYEELIDALSQDIESYLRNNKEDTEYFLTEFGFIEIDGIPIEISIFINPNSKKYMFNINAKNILYEDEDDADDKVALMIGIEFENVKRLLQQLENIIKTYTFIDCFLLSPIAKKRVFLQRSFLFSFSKHFCCVCENPTIEYTTCKHPICLQCRCKCILDGNKVCPVCKNGDLQKYPNQLRSVVDYCL